MKTQQEEGQYPITNDLEKLLKKRRQSVTLMSLRRGIGSSDCGKYGQSFFGNKTSVSCGAYSGKRGEKLLCFGSCIPMVRVVSSLRSYLVSRLDFCILGGGFLFLENLHKILIRSARQSNLISLTTASNSNYPVRIKNIACATRNGLARCWDLWLM